MPDVEVLRLIALAREVETLQQKAARIPKLEEDLKFQRCETEMWQKRAEDLAVRTESYRAYDRNSLEFHISVDRRFLHEARVPEQMLAEVVLRHLRNHVGSYFKRGR